MCVCVCVYLKANTKIFLLKVNLSKCYCKLRDAATGKPANRLSKNYFKSFHLQCKTWLKGIFSCLSNKWLKNEKWRSEYIWQLYSVI